ncbi:MAG: T9SS type A sorting domain-containing protein [Flavobacteriales bacterium]|nr:T9SS type A sorting domain-containing protein [Flavobacteriales bacterium]
MGNTAINTGGDPNEIECSEAAAYTGTILCNNLNISDLTGIEGFVNLTQLTCSGNNLNSLDVTSNTALTLLQCDFNSITSIDVSQNTNLTYFRCFNNQISSIDVSLNLQIVNLGVENNLLTSLNTANGNNSNFTYFRADQNPNLTCITVDNTAYSTTNWTSIDATSSFSTNCGTVGVNEITQTLELTTYPNPTTGKVTFSTTEQINSIEIHNLTGQKVTTFNNTNTIDISNLTNGVYFAKIITATNNSVMQKIIKE